MAERSLFLWNNEYIVSLVAQHRQSILPLVFGALEENANSHWNPAVHGLTCNVRKMFQDLDEPLYEQCQRTYERQKQEEEEQQRQREQHWQAMQQMAEQRRGVPAT